MINEKKVFGMTPEEVGQVKRSVAEWTDENHPKTRKEVCDFASAFTEGARLLRADETFANAFNLPQGM